jgi:hypothetical protein
MLQSSNDVDQLVGHDQLHGPSRKLKVHELPPIFSLQILKVIMWTGDSEISI